MAGEGTFFKIDRKIFDSDIWLQPVELRLFIYLIGQARHSKEPCTKYKNKGVVIKRGQYLRSYRKLRDDLEYMENNSIKSYSLSRIKTAIDNLAEQGRIKTKKTQLGTLFTVVNYAEYQGSYTKKDTASNGEKTASERSANGVRTECERSANNTKNVKNDNNDNKSNRGDKFSIEKLDNGRYKYPAGYEKAYKVYPDNKGTKKAGWRKWAARRREDISNEKLIKAAKNYNKKIEYEDTDKKYVKHISTFYGPDDHWREFLEYEVDEDNKNISEAWQVM